jgi:dolichyl-phosphate-mannose--protein O-mannosyl transferase
VKNTGVYKLLIAITVAGAALRLYGLVSQPLTNDDIIFVYVTKSYGESGYLGHTMWYHPQIRNIFLYLSAEMFGYEAYALRGASFLSGILSIPLTFAVVRLCTGNARAGLIAAFLLALEQVHITYSRQTLGEPVTVLFILLGTAFFIWHWREGKPVAVVLAGLSFGMATASKFHAIPPLLLCFAFSLYFAARRRRVNEAVFMVMCYGALAFTVYLACYYPWFTRGYGLIEWFQMQAEIITKMVEHTGNPGELLSQIHLRAWQWFLKPTGYVDFFIYKGRPHVTAAFTNPAVWMMVLPSVGYTVWSIFKKPMNRDQRLGFFFLVLMFLVSYVPLATAGRPVFLLSSLSVLPFAFGCVGILASDIFDRIGKRAMYAAAVVVIRVGLRTHQGNRV